MSDTPRTDCIPSWTSNNEWREHYKVLERELAEAQKELDLLRQYAAGTCVIQKVIDELGPVTLCTVEEYNRMKQVVLDASKINKAK